MKIFTLLSIFFIPTIVTLFNSGTIGFLNSYLDKSNTVPYYLRINRKNSSSNKNGNSYNIFLTSWNGSKDFYCCLSKKEFDCYSQQDIIKVNTRKGYFGYDYYLPFSPSDIVDTKLFPKDTVFPLTEEEAKKILSFQKNLKRKKNYIKILS